jgi:hypothetical protein
MNRQAQRFTLSRFTGHSLLTPEKRRGYFIKLLIALQTLEQHLPINVIALNKALPRNLLAAGAVLEFGQFRPGIGITGI